MLNGPRVLSLVSCDPCSKVPVPSHAEHVGNGCDIWRSFQPMAELRRQGYAPFSNGEPGAQWAWKDEDDAPMVADLFDAVILPRLSWHDRRVGERFIGALHRAGKAAIFEVDDDLFSPAINQRLQQTTSVGQSLAELERKRLDRLAALRLCDGVTVASRRLATVLRGLTDRPVLTVPNAIDVRWFRAVVKQAPRLVRGLTVGWAGGARPDDDLEPMARAWGQLAQRYPDVTFIVAGHQPDIIGQYVPAHRVRRLPWVEPALYPTSFAQFDIACCAVSDTPFSRSKTPIKVWESTLGGAAVVATPALYGQTIEDGVDGLLAETAREWEGALATLIESKLTRRELRAGQLHRIRCDHSLTGNAWRWPAAWTQIVADFRQRQTAPLARELILAGR